LAAANKLQNRIWKDFVEICEICLGAGPLQNTAEQADAAAAVDTSVITRQNGNKGCADSCRYPRRQK
jgi:hypothetical protein